jgi:hypothetical protein
MHCDTSSRPRVDLTKVAHPRAVHVAVLNFIKGVRGPRNVPVTRKQIGQWLAFTPAQAVDVALCDLVADGSVYSAYNSLRYRNTARRSIVYQVQPRP